MSRNGGLMMLGALVAALGLVSYGFLVWTLGVLVFGLGAGAALERWARKPCPRCAERSAVARRALNELEPHLTFRRPPPFRTDYEGR